jgi:hypothetical protein
MHAAAEDSDTMGFIEPVSPMDLGCVEPCNGGDVLLSRWP